MNCLLSMNVSRIDFLSIKKNFVWGNFEIIFRLTFRIIKSQSPINFATAPPGTVCRYRLYYSPQSYIGLLQFHGNCKRISKEFGTKLMLIRRSSSFNEINFSPRLNVICDKKAACVPAAGAPDSVFTVNRPGLISPDAGSVRSANRVAWPS